MPGYSKILTSRLLYKLSNCDYDISRNLAKRGMGNFKLKWCSEWIKKPIIQFKSFNQASLRYIKSYNESLNFLANNRKSIFRTQELKWEKCNKEITFLSKPIAKTIVLKTKITNIIINYNQNHMPN